MVSRLRNIYNESEFFAELTKHGVIWASVKAFIWGKASHGT